MSTKAKQKVPTKNKLPLPYVFPGYCLDKIIKDLEIVMSNHHIAQLQSPTFIPPGTNSLCLTVPEVLCGQDFEGQGHL